MKRKGLLLLTCMLFLVGCGEQNNKLQETAGEEKNMTQKSEDETGTESMSFETMKNGDPVFYALTETAKLEADVVLPEDWQGKAELCHVKLENFDADLLAPELFPDIREEEWEHYYGAGTRDYTDGTRDILIEQGVYYYTYNWWEQEAYFPLNRQRVKEDEFVGEFSFASREEIAAQAEAWLTDKVGLEEVRVDRIYSVPRELIFEEYQRRNSDPEAGTGKSGGVGLERNTVEDFNDCYWLDITQYVNGLPLLGDAFTRQDEVYIPDGEILMGYTENGLEDACIVQNYVITGKEEKSLCPLDAVFASLVKKFELTISADTTIDGMQLIYFPYPVSSEERTYDLIPVWEFTFTEGGRRQHIYINALDGKEIVS